MAKGSGTVSSTGFSLAGAAAQWGGIAMGAYGLSPLSGKMGSVFMGAGAAIATVGIAIGFGNLKK